MKIVVLGRDDKAANAIDKVKNDTYHYVKNVDDALKAVKTNRAEMLVIENSAVLKSPLAEVVVELNRMPQDVRIIVLSPSRHYFLITTNTLDTTVNYHITEKRKINKINEKIDSN